MGTSGRVIGIAFSLSLSALLFSVSLLPNESDGGVVTSLPLAKVAPAEVVIPTTITDIETPTSESIKDEIADLVEEIVTPADVSVTKTKATLTACDPACKCGVSGLCTCGADCPCKCEKATEVGTSTGNFTLPSTSLTQVAAGKVTSQVVGQRVVEYRSYQRPQPQRTYRVVSGPFRLLSWIVPNISSTTPVTAVVTHAEPFSMSTKSVLVPSPKTQVIGQPAQPWTALPNGYTTPAGSRQTICSGGSCSRGW